MTITNTEQLIAAKNKIRELIKEASHASATISFYEPQSPKEKLTHPSDIMFLSNAKLYEKQIMKEISEIHIAMTQYRGFPVAPEKN